MQARLAVSIEVADSVSLALHLTAEKSPLILVQNFPDVFDAVHSFRPVVREYGRVGLRGRRFVVRFGIGRVVAQQVILDQHSAGIDPKAVDPDDVELLQDMVLAAVNEALRSAQELASSKLGGIAGGLGGLGLPGL